MMSLALAPAELKSMVDEIWSSLFEPAPTDSDQPAARRSAPRRPIGFG